MNQQKVKKIDDLMERAAKALKGTKYIEAETLATEALLRARKINDFQLMARICMPLQEARRQRFLAACDAAKNIKIIDEPYEETLKVKPGCYLFQPPMVAADGRRLRALAKEQKKNIAVLCREPITQLGLQPIVALGPIVVRTIVRPPKNVEKPDMAWFIDSIQALGDSAIDGIDPAIQGERLVDALLDRLETVIDHEQLHQALAAAAQETARLQAA